MLIISVIAARQTTSKLVKLPKMKKKHIIGLILYYIVISITLFGILMFIGYIDSI